MQVIALGYPTLAVSAIYCIWHAYLRHRLNSRRLLHERVAHMLWVMASGVTE
jgi:hypothetical protein